MLLDLSVEYQARTLLLDQLRRAQDGRDSKPGSRQALKIADYVYVLELGRNKFEGPAKEFDDLEKAFWVA